MNDYDKFKGKVVCVDVDGLFCTGESWTVEDCLKAKPIIENIEKINKIYEFGFIVIYTARRDDLLDVTLQWLRLNGVKFHAISNNKIPSDFYIDDKMISI